MLYFQKNWRCSKSKLELNSKTIELEWCKNYFVCVYVFSFCTLKFVF